MWLEIICYSPSHLSEPIVGWEVSSKFGDGAFCSYLKGALYRASHLVSAQLTKRDVE